MEVVTGTMPFGDEKTNRSQRMAPSDVQGLAGRNREKQSLLFMIFFDFFIVHLVKLDNEFHTHNHINTTTQR